MNVAHHASYIPWLEMGRTELLRGAGVTYAHLEAQGTLLVVAKLNIVYKRPARYDDVVEVRTRWSGGSRVKVEHDYEVTVIEPGTSHPSFTPFTPFTAAAASTTLGCVDRNGTIQPLPSWLVYPKDNPSTRANA